MPLWGVQRDGTPKGLSHKCSVEFTPFPLIFIEYILLNRTVHCRAEETHYSDSVRSGKKSIHTIPLKNSYRKKNVSFHRSCILFFAPFSTRMYRKIMHPSFITSKKGKFSPLDWNRFKRRCVTFLLYALRSDVYGGWRRSLQSSSDFSIVHFLLMKIM